MSLNVFVVQGNIVAEPTFHGEGETVARFTIANNTGFGDNAESHFFDCVAFGKQVETIKKYLTKGKEIVVRGKVVQRRWKTDEGENRSKLEVRLENFEGFSFTNGGSRGAEAEAQPESEPVAVAATAGSDKKKLF
jgi:single-strand DNA-binding protein